MALRKVDTCFTEADTNADNRSYDLEIVETPEMFITYWHNRLRIDYNEVGFTRRDVEAICRVGRSTKSRSESQIGEKGIGFKSVFKIADVVSIFSGYYSFKFDRTETDLGMIIPGWGESPVEPFSGFTSILPQIRDEYDQEELRQAMKSMDTRHLMFLKRPKKIRTAMTNRDGRDESRRTTTLSHDNRKVTYLVRQHIAKRLPDEPKRVGRMESPTLLAFPLPVTQEDKVESQQVYTFLPIRDYCFTKVVLRDAVLNPFVEKAGHFNYTPCATPGLDTYRTKRPDMTSSRGFAMKSSNGFVAVRSVPVYPSEPPFPAILGALKGELVNILSEPRGGKDEDPSGFSRPAYNSTSCVGISSCHLSTACARNHVHRVLFADNFSSEYQLLQPVLDIPQPQDSRWMFLKIFGVMVRDDINTYVRILGRIQGLDVSVKGADLETLISEARVITPSTPFSHITDISKELSKLLPESLSIEAANAIRTLVCLEIFPLDEGGESATGFDQLSSSTPESERLLSGTAKETRKFNGEMREKDANIVYSGKYNSSTELAEQLAALCRVLEHEKLDATSAMITQKETAECEDGKDQHPSLTESGFQEYKSLGGNEQKYGLVGTTMSRKTRTQRYMFLVTMRTPSVTVSKSINPARASEITSSRPSYIALNDAPQMREYVKSREERSTPKRDTQNVADSCGLEIFERPRIVSFRIIFVPSPQELPSETFSVRPHQRTLLPGRAKISQSGGCTIFLAVESTNKIDTYTEFLRELFVSKLLEKHLGKKYDPNTQWTSHYRQRAGHRSFKMRKKSMTTFTLYNGSAMTEFLIRSGSGWRWKGNYPHHHILVKTTKGGQESPFIISPGDMDMICRYRAPEDEHLPEVVILVRVFDMESVARASFFVDPWSMYACGRMKLYPGEVQGRLKGKLERVSLDSLQSENEFGTLSYVWATV
ncbi:hypothetical protein K469DRAFT_754481 [Zopfia rhizophila CBS 207.26]|uniref:Sacsin/Nov domain-containing protein n=1 Tax=Zopfia rhizophila CBS 207.26 TaxID=1314779 RepID=A0A6A6DI95_9PEZI|nr:hypothetical protein K469DRAFT_754481 [Zopfia rhizophila CBS 207.26]